MTRQEAVQRLRQTSDFTFVGGRVLIKNARILAALGELRAQAPTRPEAAAGPLPRASGGAPR